MLSVFNLLLYCQNIYLSLKCFSTYLKSRIKKFILLFNLLISLSVYAQDKNNIVLKGTVVNQENKPVDGSAVYILNPLDSSIVKIEICNQSGSFTFINLKAAPYLLKVTSLSYKTLFYGPFKLSVTAPLKNVGKLILKKSTTDLQEVSIHDRKPYIESQPGKVILNVENSLVSSGSTAYDILKSAPGVQMDAEDNIRLNGKQNVLVIINGKQTFMERDALIDMLKGTQSNEISQIELISNPTATFDAAGSGSVINIKIKKNKNFGANGNINLIGGVSALEFNAKLNHRFNTALNLNFRNRVFNVFGSYNFADNNQNRTINASRIINNNQLTNIDVNYESLIKRLTHTYRLGLDLNLHRNHVIGLIYNVSDNEIGIAKNNLSSISNFNNLDSTIRTGSEQGRGLKNEVLNFNYKGNLGNKLGEISFDLDRINYSRKSNEVLSNDFYDAGNLKYRSSILLRNNSPSEYEIVSAKIDYSLPVSNSSKLEIGMQTSRVKGDSNLEFGQIVASVYYPDTRFVNHFLIEEQIASGYINYSIGFKNSDLNLGLRAEKTISEGVSLTTGQVTNKNYLNFFPNLQFVQNINLNNRLLFSYSRRITRPGYDNLNPFLNYLDQYSYRAGNPLLQPEFVRIAEVTHNYKNKFTTTLRAKVIDDLIIELNEQNDLTKVNTIISRNINRQYFYGIELNMPVTVNNWWMMNLNLLSAYEKYIVTTSTEDFKNTSPSLIFSSLQSFRFTEDFSAEINGKYESPTIYGIYNFKSAYSFDLAIGKSFLNKNATARLRITDVLNTASNRYTSTFQNLNLRYRDKRDSMMGQISFSYVFGRNTVKGARKRDTGSENVQDRLGN